jgi:hypothetical protein
VRKLLFSFLAGSALFVLPSASAKDFRPGDLRMCGKTRCVAIVNGAVLPVVGAFYYTGPCPARVETPKLGASYYELRFRNGYVTGIVATQRLDRFLTHGVHDGRFARDIWYAVPRKLSRELRQLTVRPAPGWRGATASSR